MALFAFLRGASLAGVALMFGSALAVGLLACDDPESPAPDGPAPPSSSLHERPAGARGFAAAGACAECHAVQQSAWQGSHHDRAIEPATPETVVADFDGTRFTHFGVTTRFRRREGRFFVETEGADGEMHEFPIAFAVGIEPLQQYLVEFPGGRLQTLTIAWDTERRAWFSLYPDWRIEPGDPLHWTGRLQRWNTMCAECHSTALDRGYDVAEDRYRTAYAELDVGCQACHGGGAAHVAWARGSPAPSPGTARDALVVHFDPRAPGIELDTCAPCHSRRHRVSDDVGIGEPFADHYALELLRPDLYHADGQIRAEVYVHGSFLQSLMHRRGVRCSDCHDPHSLALRAEGNALCTRCHSERPDPRFATLTAKRYDASEHHFHPAGSPGAQCVACHMPEKTFMQVDGRRDHSLRIPRPDLATSLGAPNACSACHRDRDAAWAAGVIAALRPDAPPSRDLSNFGEILAAARDGMPDAAPSLVALIADSTVPGIVRATGLGLLPALASAGAVDVQDAVLAAARDEDALVRSSAARALGLLPDAESSSPAEGSPAAERFRALVRLLSDPRRAVRIEAGRVLAADPLDRFTPQARDALASAHDEFRAAQRAVSDTPEAHLNLGVLHAQRDEPARAETAYRTAIKIAPDFLPARVNLAHLYNALGRNDEALRQLRAAIAVAREAPEPRGPEERTASSRQQGEIQYSLGLLLAEMGLLEQAEAALAQAAARLPRMRIRYNRGLALQQLGRRREAEALLQEALELAPESAEVLRALAVFYMQGGRPERAFVHAQRAVALAHGSAESRQLQQLLVRIRANLESRDPPSDDPG